MTTGPISRQPQKCNSKINSAFMVKMEEDCVSLDPETGLRCTLYLYTNVQNASEIRKKILSGELSCCILKAALVVDPFQVVVAANKAAVNSKFGHLTTKSLNTEILFNLSISKNISRSLTEFGIGDSDKDIIVALIHEDNVKDELLKTLDGAIEGERTPIARLPEFTNNELVKKTYKIDKEELGVSSLVNCIVSKMSCKDFASLK